MTFNKIIKYFIAWRFILFVFSLPAMLILPLKSGFTTLTNQFSADNLLRLWSNFDGIKYLNLAQFGYGTPITKDDNNLFPFYPWLINKFEIFDSPLISSLIISHLCLIISLYLIYRLIKTEFSEKIATTSISLLLIFPTAFFLVSSYSESLFLLLAISCFYFARKKNFLLASAFAALASYTRLMGIFLLPFLLIEFWLEHQKNIKSMIHDYRLISFILAPLGLVNFLKLQELRTGDALLFLRDKPLFSPDRVINKIILLYQVFFRYLRMIIFMDHTDPLFFTVLLEFIVGIAFFILVIISFRRLRLSYAVYSLLIYLIPTLGGSFISLPRYVVVIFPLFIILAIWFEKQRKITKIIYLSLNIIFTLISISLFSRGYFIS
jgi:Gpi18-like mannosyltransferase